MTPLVALVSVLVALLTVTDWRRGLLAVIVVGVLQDSLRKLTPGVPTYFIVWSMAMYMFVVVIAVISRTIPPSRILMLNDQKVGIAWSLFLIMIVLQLFNALLRWGSPVVPIFGAIFYLGPPLAMLIGCGFATSQERIRSYLRFYALVMVPTCLTVFLSLYWQDIWPVLRDIGSFTGQQLIIYDVGRALKSYSGILRAGEISAWHAATAAIFLSTLAITSKGSTRKIFFVILIALLIAVIILTGRRKMLMTLSMFFIFQWALMARFKRGMGKLAVIIVLVGTVGSFSFSLLEPASESRLYVQRSSSVFGDAVGRMQYSLILLKSAFNRSSGMGLGAGSAAQGAKHAGIDQSKLVGGSGESGLGMIMVELGVLGLLLVGWLFFISGISVLGNLRRLAALDENLFIYQVAFLSFLFANLITFTVATQIYGDFFVLIVLGTIAGFALRINDFASRHALKYA